MHPHSPTWHRSARRQRHKARARVHKCRAQGISPLARDLSLLARHHSRPSYRELSKHMGKKTPSRNGMVEPRPVSTAAKAATLVLLGWIVGGPIFETRIHEVRRGTHRREFLAEWRLPYSPARGRDTRQPTAQGYSESTYQCQEAGPESEEGFGAPCLQTAAMGGFCQADEEQLFEAGATVFRQTSTSYAKSSPLLRRMAEKQLPLCSVWPVDKWTWRRKLSSFQKAVGRVCSARARRQRKVSCKMIFVLRVRYVWARGCQPRRKRRRQ